MSAVVISSKHMHETPSCGGASGTRDNDTRAEEEGETHKRVRHWLLRPQPQAVKLDWRDAGLRAGVREHLWKKMTLTRMFDNADGLQTENKGEAPSFSSVVVVGIHALRLPTTNDGDNNKDHRNDNHHSTLDGLYSMPPLSLGEMQNTPMSKECASCTFSRLPPSTLPSRWSVPDAV